MYYPDMTEAELILSYSDVFKGEEIPDLYKEILSLNIHKSVTIICELIRVRSSMLEPIEVEPFAIEFSLETVLKRDLCGIKPDSPEEMVSNPLLNKNAHIISLQALLLLLKKILTYGNRDTINNSEYEITKNDYAKIIRLELLVVEELNEKHEREFDKSHFLYSTYHLNYQRNVAHEFMRMYYIMEKLCQDKDNFTPDVQREYKDYYTDFACKYGFNPTEYSSLLFGELSFYYNDVNGLACKSLWKSIDNAYVNIREKDKIGKIISVLSKPIEGYNEWANESIDQEWNFSEFFSYPFIRDGLGHYISISDVTMRNSFFEKLFWLIRDCYPNDSRAMSFFGRLFEKYIQDITENAISGEYAFINEFTYVLRRNEKKSSDAYVIKDSNLLVIEAKGFSVLQNCMIKNEDVEKNIKKLFISPILQADTALNDFIQTDTRFTRVENAYIISVTMDNINAVPDYYNYAHQEIAAKKKCGITKYFFNLNIEEYEMLLCLLERGEDIFAILGTYFCEQRLKPFSNYLQDRYANIDMTSFMENVYHEATDHMKCLLFGDQFFVIEPFNDAHTF